MNFILGRTVEVCRSVVEYLPNKKEAMTLSPSVTGPTRKPKASRKKFISVWDLHI